MFRDWFRKLAVRRMNRAARRSHRRLAPHLRLDVQPLEERTVPALVINSAASGGMTEFANTTGLSAPVRSLSGAITFTDDANDTRTANDTPGSTTGYVGTFTLDAAPAGLGTSAFDWHFTVAD